MEEKSEKGCDAEGIISREKITIDKGGDSQDRKPPIDKGSISTDRGKFKTK